ncbi:MAG: hypothetical protein CL946_05965, partial [Ectothiorhodospiraceae bacterium]|nr:hypothetical protein [Ectothiorhodospiraceae bacterium]
FVTEENFFEAERSRLIATKHPAAVPGSWEHYRILARKSPPPSPAAPGSTVLDPESERIIVSHGNTVAFSVSTGQDISLSTNSRLLTGDLRWYGEKLFEVNTKRVESYSYYYGRRYFSIYNAGTLYQTRKEECDVGFHGDELRIYLSHRNYNYWLEYDPISNEFHNGPMHKGFDVRSLETLAKQPDGDRYIGLLMEDASDLNVSWALHNGEYHITDYISPFYSLGDPKLEIEPYRGERLFHPRWVSDDVVVFYAWFSGAKELWAYSLSRDELTQITGYERGVVPGQHGEHESSYADAPSFTYDPVRDKIMLLCIHDSFRYDLLLIDPPR